MFTLLVLAYWITTQFCASMHYMRYADKIVMETELDPCQLMVR